MAATACVRAVVPTVSATSSPQARSSEHRRRPFDTRAMSLASALARLLEAAAREEHRPRRPWMGESRTIEHCELN